MHETTVKTKDGKTVNGILWVVRPKNGWFKLSVGNDIVKFKIKDCVSVVTKNDRISKNKIGDINELERWGKDVKERKGE